MATEAIQQYIDATPTSKLKHAVIGFLVGLAFASFCAYLYVQELKLQVVDDIQYERDYIVAAYKPVLEKLTVEERSAWAENLPERERNVENSGIEGATVGTFRDSWIKMMYEAGCGYNDLKAVSGIRTKSTLDAKIRPLERELEKVFNSVFSRIN